MINRIGVIYQGPNDLGFIRGLKTRLQCEAEIIFDETRGKNQISKRRDFEKNCKSFLRRAVDLIVRLTDADPDRWQDVQREELSRVPPPMAELVVCGVTTDCIEDWMASSPTFVRTQLEVDADILRHSNAKPLVQQAIKRKRAPGETLSRTVERLVTEADSECVREWARERSFETFYRDCVAAARRQDCPVNLELERSQSSSPE